MFFYTKLILFVLLLTSQIVNCGNWSVENLSIGVSNQEMVIKIDSLKIPFADDLITEISYNCIASNEIYPKHHCKDGQISFRHNDITYELLVSGWVNLFENKWNLVIEDKNNFIKVSVDSDNQERVSLVVTNLPISDFLGFLKPYVFVDDLMVDGFLSTQVMIDVSDRINITAEYQVEGFTWESQDSQYVIAESQHQGKINLEQKGLAFELLIHNKINQGEALIKDVYLSFDDNPMKLSSVLTLDNEFNPQTLKLTVLSTPEVKFIAELSNWSDNNLKVHFQISNLDAFNKIFLTSYLELLGINDLILSGESNGVIYIRNSKINKVDMVINHMDLSIESKKTKLSKVDALIKWEDIGEPLLSFINWENMLLAGMPIKESKLSFSSVGQHLVLQEDTIVPIFDGSLLINELSLKNLFEPQISIDFDGEINPVSIALVTEKMGWPRMIGTISGKIPGMKKIGNSITFDGSLDINIFGGTMLINNLSTERLFGIAPVIASDIKFQNLNLQQITSTFDFGEITGLIDGYINNLRITNWKADRLDAHIHSVKSKSVKQTISQRAIDNISSIGGIQGALSRSFLRFFDYFKYKNIGIGCKLRNSICEMSGIKTSDKTYRIIEGKGVPSININGFRRFIDWEVFLERLLNAGYY